MGNHQRTIKLLDVRTVGYDNRADERDVPVEIRKYLVRHHGHPSSTKRCFNDITHTPSVYEEQQVIEPAHGDAAPLPARFWWYAGFTALNIAGCATFAVLAYHLQVRDVVSEATIPVMYAVAMGMAALAALASGWLYDRVGLRGLVVVPALTAAVPFLSFSTQPALVWIGAAVWGVAVGVDESTMRAAVADLVPAVRRGGGCWTLTGIYGLA